MGDTQSKKGKMKVGQRNYGLVTRRNDHGTNSQQNNDRPKKREGTKMATDKKEQGMKTCKDQTKVG